MHAVRLHPYLRPSSINVCPCIENNGDGSASERLRILFKIHILLSKYHICCAIYFSLIDHYSMRKYFNAFSYSHSKIAIIPIILLENIQNSWKLAVFGLRTGKLTQNLTLTPVSSFQLFNSLMSES